VREDTGIIPETRNPKPESRSSEPRSPETRNSKPETRYDALIIGGGVGGLASAFRLRQRDPRARIAVCEAAGRFGGVTGTTMVDGFLGEHGPDSLVRTKPAGMRLVADLGLADEVIGTEPDARAGLIARGRRLLPVPEGLYLMAPGRILPFLRSPLVSWPGKLRMGLDLVIPPRTRPGREESLAGFVRRRLGREALERIAQPLVGGIYTADPERLSVAATMPLFLEAEREHGSLIRAMRARVDAASASGPRYSLFASLRGGLGALVDRLVARLADCDLRTGCPVTALVRDGDGWVAATPHGPVRARRVVLALPAWAAARLLAPIDGILAAELAAVPYAGVATVGLAVPLERLAPLPAAAGFVVPAVERRTVLACTFVHRKYAGRAPAGWAHLRAFVGGALHPDDADLPDDALRAAVRRDLADLAGLQGEPRWLGIHRWPRAMCQPEVGHRERTARIRARAGAIPGLALVGNGYEGVGIPDLAEQAERLTLAP
jgi:oxygen-dependent protoporphyrinogen oxidase